MNLPKGYIEYMESVPPMSGDTDFDMGVGYELEPLTAVERLNRDVGIEEFAPGFIAFATDGGNELFVFDASGKVYLMPMVGMEPKVAVLLADSFAEFLQHLRPVCPSKRSNGKWQRQ